MVENGYMQNETDLQEQLNELQRLTDETPAMLTRCSSDFRYLYANRAYAETLGLTRDQIVGRLIVEVMGEAGFAAIRPYVERALTGETVHYEETVPFGPAGPRRLRVTYVPDRGPDGVVKGWFASVTDVTAEWEAKEALRESELRSRAIVSVLADVPWRASANGELIGPHPEQKKFTNTTTEQNAGGSWANNIHPDDRQRVMELWRHAVETGTPYESHGRIWHTPSQSYHYYVGRAIPVRNDDGSIREWIGALTDVHEQKVAEEALRESEALFKRLVQNLPDIVARFDREHRHVFISDAVTRLTGMEPRDFIGKTNAELGMDPELCWIGDRKIEEAFAGKPGSFEFTFPTSGGARNFVCTLVPERDEKGEVQSVLSITRDVTEQKQAAEAMRSTSEQLQIVTDCMPTTIARCSRDLKYLWVNRACAESFGLQPEDIVGHPIIEILGSDVFGMLRPHFDKVLRGETTFYEREVDFGGRGPRWTHAVYTPTFDAEGQADGWVAVSLDITERRLAEMALQAHSTEIERLNERLQRAMSETHHRVKNNLQVIAALINMQTLQENEFVPVSELERLNQHVQSLAALHDLLTRQAKTDGGSDEVSVQAALKQLAPMLQGLIQGRTLRLNIANVRLPVSKATTLLVLVNELVSNAVKHGKGEVSVSFHLQGTRACLQVDDQGPGFPDGFNPRSAAHTGLDLIESLARHDLQATTLYRTRPEGGGSVLLDFPLYVLSNSPKQVKA